MRTHSFLLLLFCAENDAPGKTGTLIQRRSKQELEFKFVIQNITLWVIKAGN